jgi:hypothetical protein
LFLPPHYSIWQQHLLYFFPPRQALDARRRLIPIETDGDADFAGYREISRRVKGFASRGFGESIRQDVTTSH